MKTCARLLPTPPPCAPASIGNDGAWGCRRLLTHSPSRSFTRSHYAPTSLAPRSTLSTLTTPSLAPTPRPSRPLAPPHGSALTNPLLCLLPPPSPFSTPSHDPLRRHRRPTPANVAFANKRALTGEVLPPNADEGVFATVSLDSTRPLMRSTRPYSFAPFLHTRDTH